MNRVYKLIWNNARNMYIAVSEIAKSHRKETLRGGKKTAAIFLAALYLCGTGFAANTVQAESNSPVLTDEQKNEIVDKVLEKLNNKTEQNKTNSVKYISVNSGNKEKKPADDSDNSKNDGAYGANSVAIGRSAKAAGQFSIALGFQSKAWNEASLSIGRGATTFNQSALAIGHEATALHIRGTAVGYYAVAGRSSIAVGPNGQALGMASVSLGEGSYVGDISFREAYKKRNNVPYYYINEVIAKDTEKWENYKNKFKEELKDLSESDAKVKLIALIMSDLNKEVKFSTAIGNQSIVGVSFGTALGFGSRVNSEKAVALGADSLAERSGNPVGYVLGEANSTLDEVITSVGLKDKYDDLKGKTDPDLPTYNELKKRYKEAVKPDDEKQALKDLKNWEKTHEEFLKNLNERKNFEGTWKGSSGVVSVGNKKTGMTRQITGVAAGSEDTDAVNVAQLKALNTKVDNNRKAIEKSGQNGSVKYFSVNPDNNKRPKPAKGSDNSKNDGAYGENSVAIGAFAEAADANALALGWSVKALGQDSLALGTMVYSYGRNSHAVGNQAAALGEESSAFGNQAKAMDMGTTALGNNAMAIQNGSTAVGYQSLSTISSTSMGTNSYALGQASLALGQRSYIGDTTFRDTYTKYNEEKGNDNNIPGYYISDLIKKNDPKIAKYKEQFKNQLQGLDGHNQEAVLRYLIIADLNKSVQFATAVGNHSTVGASQGTALGFYSTVTGAYGTALGYNSRATAYGAMSAGAYAKASTVGSVAIGFQSKVNNYGGVAIGSEATVGKKGGVALGNKSTADRGSGAVGYVFGADNSTLTKALEAPGNKARFDELKMKIKDEDVSAYNALVMTFKNAAKDSPEKEKAKQEIEKWKAAHPDFLKNVKARKNFENAWQSTYEAVSVGDVEKGITRQITGVAAGSEDTDAVNVAQLKVVNAKVDQNKTDITEINKKITNLGESSGWTLAVARGDDSKTDSEATAEGTSAKVSGGTVTLKAGRGVKLKQDGTNVQIGLKFIDMDPAGYPFNDAKATGGGSLAVGQNSVAKKNQATAVGLDTEADEYGVALGTTSKAGKSAVAIGNRALANGEGSIAIGDGARKVKGDPSQGYRKVDSVNAIAIGTEAVVGEKSVASSVVGYHAEIAQSEWSSALGGYSKIENSKYASALGAVSKVENAAYGTALGSNAAVINARGGVALGAYSVADRNGFMPGYNPAGEQWNNLKDYLEKTGKMDAFNQASAKFQAAYQAWEKDKNNPELLANYYQAKAEQSKIFNTWAGSQGAVSIGNEKEGYTRQLTGLAAGTKDTDAVNVAQLKALNTKVDKNVTDITNLKGGFTIKDTATGTVDVTLGETTKSAITFKAATEDTDGATSALTATVDDQKNVTYTLNTKKLKEEMGLNNLGTGTMSSWKLKAGTTDAQAIADGDEVEFAVETADKGLTVKRDGKKIQYGINADKLVENINSATTKITNVDGDNIDLSKNTSIKTINENITKLAGKVTKVTVNGKDDNSDDADANLKIKKTEKDGQLTYDLSLNDEITIGKDGKDGKIGLNGKDGKSAEIIVGKGEDGVDGTNGKDGITRIIYKDQGNKTHEVATLDDGLKFKGDNDSVVIRKLNTQLNITGGATVADLSENNIGVVGTAGDNGGLAVKLSKKLTGLTSAEFKDGDNITNITGGNISITKKVNNQNETKNINLWDLSTTVNNFKGGFTIKDTASGTANVTLGDTNKPAITFKAETKNDNGATSALTATVDDQKNVTYTLNTKKLKEEMGLTKGVGSMSSWKLKVGTTDAQAIADGDEVEFAVETADKGLTVKRDGKKIQYGINADKLVENINSATTKITNVDGDNIDLSKNTSIKTINENITKLAGKVTKVTVNGKDDNSDDADANLKIKKTEKDGQLTYDLSLNDEITIGKDGKDGKIGLNGKDGHSAEIIVGKGEDGVDGTNGKDGITRIIYKDQGNKTHEVATLDDGLKFKGDNDSVVIRKLNTQLNITGGATATDLSENNIGVVGTAGDNGGLAVKLSKKLTGLTSAEFKDGDNITNITGGNISITKKVNNQNETKNIDLWDLSTTVNNFKGGFTIKDTASGTANVTLGDTNKPAITFKAETKNDNGATSVLTAKVDDQKNVTYTLNTKKLKETLGLNQLGTGTMSSWKLKVGNESTDISNGNEVTFAASTDEAAKGLSVKKKGNVITYGINKSELVGNIAGDIITEINKTTNTTKITNVDWSKFPGMNFYTQGSVNNGVYTPDASADNKWNSSHIVFGKGIKVEKLKDKDNNQVTKISLDGTGGTGTNGKDGKSAYEIWRDHEENGAKPNKDKTEKEFLDSLKGKDGTNGTKGTDGKDGTNGINGTNGKSAYEIWEAHVDKDGTQPNKGKGEQEFLDSLKGKDGIGEDKVEEIKTEFKNEITKRMNEFNTESVRGDALGAALSALKPLDYDPYNRSQIMAGVSTYKGQEAIALGLAYYSNENTLLHAGLSYAGSSELMANAGISYRFGSSYDRKLLGERNKLMPQYKGGVISSVYVMQDEMVKLQKENTELKNEVKEANERTKQIENETNARIAKLEAQIQALIAAR